MPLGYRYVWIANCGDIFSLLGAPLRVAIFRRSRPGGSRWKCSGVRRVRLECSGARGTVQMCDLLRHQSLGPSLLR